MLQRYKLRLGDGTLLVVDHDALSSWLVDAKAMVQPVGSARWWSLKRFLWEERSGRGTNPWWSSRPSEEIPGVHRALLQDIPPLPSEAEAPPSPPPLEAQVLAEDPSAPVLEPPPTGGAEPHLPSEGLQGETGVEVSTNGEESPLVISEPESLWSSGGQPAAPPPGSDLSSPTLDGREGIPLMEGVEAKGSPGSFPRESTGPDPQEVAETAPSPAPSSYPARVDDATPIRLEPLEDDHRVFDREVPASPPSPGPNLQVLAEEAVPLARIGARRRIAATEGPPARLEAQEEDLPRGSNAYGTEPGPSAPRMLNLQVLAEEALTSSARPRPAADSASRDRVSLKLLDDNVPLPPTAAEEIEVEEWLEPAVSRERGFLGLGRPWGPRINRWLDVLSQAVDLLGQWVGAFGRWIDGLRSHGGPSSPPEVSRRLALAEPAPSRYEGAREAPPSDPPMIVLKPLDEEEARAPSKSLRARLAEPLGQAVSKIAPQLNSIGRTLSAWTDRLGKWAKPIAGRDPSPAPHAREEVWARDAEGEILPPRQVAPPALRDLPPLRLAPDDEPVGEEEDFVYDGEEYDGPGIFEVAWLWVKRITVLSGLVLGGLIAYDTWETWLPPTAQLARGMFVEVDKRVHPPATPEQTDSEPVRLALQAATEQLPHLAPETIALVMSNSMGGVLDPPEVFRRACDAADRGKSALTGEEAQELKSLQVAMNAVLPPRERERLHEYDLVRGQRVTLPFEDREALRLVARGARSLTPAARERVQSLMGKAVAVAIQRADDQRPAPPAVR